MITVEIKDDEITSSLLKLGAALTDMSPVMASIGEALVASAKKRFPEGVSPDGAKWAPKSKATRSPDPRPLFGPSKMLSSQIFAISSAESVEVGSNRVYAAMMQFGGTKEAYPHLWGNIPARPFLGISDEDRTEVLATIADYLTAAAAP